MIFLRSDSLNFPPVSTANKEGLLAVGGDLSPARLVTAYQSGIFPWTDEPLTWWSPDPRAIFNLDTFKPHRRLEAKMRNSPFAITFDRAFETVMRQCAQRAPGRETTWISETFIHAYVEMHRLGRAHSVEAWNGDRLVGGIYGVSLGGFFAGESMFYRETDASKIALLALFDHLRKRGFQLFDTQVLSPLTARMGAVEIRRSEYLKRLQRALHCGATF